jgi:hypothetical protein
VERRLIKFVLLASSFRVSTVRRQFSKGGRFEFRADVPRWEKRRKKKFEIFYGFAAVFFVFASLDSPADIYEPLMSTWPPSTAGFHASAH